MEMHVSQPIEVGSVLGGRYQVTETVLSSAEGDLVLGGIDQVLNRSVSILVASTQNSSQLAASAREIAMGERTSSVQVLDLGISDANQTYLVSNVTRSADLLDLVAAGSEAVPYVEPFFTDTLGTEIFGESRQAVPEEYDPNAEYYEYDDSYVEEEQSPAKRGGLLGRFGKKKQAEEEPATAETAAADADATAPNVQVPPAAAASAPVESSKPKVTRLDDEPSVTATAAMAAAAQSKGEPESPAKKPEPAEKKEKKKAAAAGAAAGAASFPAAASSAPAQPAAPAADAPEEEEKTSKGTRLLVGAILVIVLVIGVVFSFKFLGGDKDTTAASETPSASQSQDEQSAPSEDESKDPELAKPKIADISRLVPGNQKLNAETDGDLEKMIDDNPSSTYQTYTYTTSKFGGFAENMVFILELEDKAAIKEINLEGLNATGGDYELLVGDSDDPGDAKSVAKGSFSGPSISVTVKDGDKEYMEGSHVFLDVTDLPRRASGANESRPFGLLVGEFSVK